MSSRFSNDALRELPAEVLRAVIRERAHHLLEESLQQRLLSSGASKVHGVNTVERLLNLWMERGLPASGEDLQWVEGLLRWAKGGAQVLPVGVPDGGEKDTAASLIQQRRSVRSWQDRPVPRQMLEEIVRAGQWAPCACNLQTLRVLIVNAPAPEDAGLLVGDVSGAPAHLVVCQDRRPYEFYRSSVPEHNRGLDCGAAMQNMLLMAHALGLGAVWLTFLGKQRERIRRRFRIPDYVDIISYISLGWPAVQPLPPGRMELDAVLLPEA
jgi:nitroreductase